MVNRRAGRTWRTGARRVSIRVLYERIERDAPRRAAYINISRIAHPTSVLTWKPAAVVLLNQDLNSRGAGWAAISDLASRYEGQAIRSEFKLVLISNLESLNLILFRIEKREREKEISFKHFYKFLIIYVIIKNLPFILNQYFNIAIFLFNIYFRLHPTLSIIDA